MLQRIEATCAYLKSQTELRPEIAIILGTGLGGLTEEISVEKEIPYSQIPGFVQSTVAGHSGKLIFGTIAGVPVMAMQGRFHFYATSLGRKMKESTNLSASYSISTRLAKNIAKFCPKGFLIKTSAEWATKRPAKRPVCSSTTASRKSAMKNLKNRCSRISKKPCSTARNTSSKDFSAQKDKIFPSNLFT